MDLTVCIYKAPLVAPGGSYGTRAIAGGGLSNNMTACRADNWGKIVLARATYTLLCSLWLCFESPTKAL